MINIVEKKDCCGCNACSQICPQNCIEMTTDEQGFWYPKVNLDFCIKCNLCEKVCPIINVSPIRKPLEVFAAKNPNDYIRKESSSGGIFTALAEEIIKKNGVVFGARFSNNFEVIHDYTENADDISFFRGSKYSQSQIGNTFIQVRKFLQNGRLVLFSGTPCQISGLYRFLQKAYPNLITVDIICHGVPSPLIWKEYLSYISRNDILTKVNFRDKTFGWKKFSTLYSYNNRELIRLASSDPYMTGFLKNIYLRPSCFWCHSRENKSNSDLTIADYWGIQKFYPEFDDDKGVSLVLINSIIGLNLYSLLNIIDIKSSLSEAILYNSAYNKDPEIPQLYNFFWSYYNKHGIKAIYKICKKLELSRTKIIGYKLKAIILKYLVQ